MLHRRQGSGLRRFWKDVSLYERETGGYGLILDDKPVSVPSGDDLRLDTRELAEAVAEEWRKQDTAIDPFSMPLTRMANTVQDRVRLRREEAVEGVLAYVDADAACYRDGRNASLSRRQAERWDGMLRRLAGRIGVHPACREGVMPFRQEQEVHAAMRQAVAALDDHALTVLQATVPLCGSAFMGLALVWRLASVEEAAAAAFVDELYQAERWGDDPEARQRRDLIAEEIAQALRFFDLVSPATSSVGPLSREER